MKSVLSHSRLDPFDRKILAIIQKDCTAPLRVIADSVCLSAPAVQRRVKRLMNDGVILSNVAVVDPAAVSPSITVIVEVLVACETCDQLEAVKHIFSMEPAIQQCYYVTGGADFVLVINVPTMADFEAFTRRLFLERMV